MKDIILIVGASSDVGRELITSLQDEEIKILAHYHSRPLQDTKNLTAIPCDLSDTKSLENFIAKIQEELPNKIVFLASPKTENVRFKNAKWSDFEEQINVSLRSSFEILKAILPKLAKDKERSKKVVFMLSNQIYRPVVAQSAYTSIKYALFGLMRSLVCEYKSANIQINAISPSMIETSFLEHIDPKIIELNAYNHPLKRNATPKDVVPVIKMLLSKDSDYLNEVNIPITGGGISNAF
ncbi:SDR family oxidoreductase [Helicobacter sp. faydin-H20]|uniref:SDR family oxidoreductase n=1 Tax=Helicobacter anatolicus TaxID=2905874 RepID=UPI001E48CA47|nr:SDR family oxidoreductase [Helicobacter anatolicus]MCE3037132.1 SDR family oxidoreductase [Helicobacter anatolicus]